MPTEEKPTLALFNLLAPRESVHAQGVLVLITAITVAAGFFDDFQQTSPYFLSLFLLLALTTSAHMYRRPLYHSACPILSPVILHSSFCVLAWICYRLWIPHLPVVQLIPAAFFGWTALHSKDRDLAAAAGIGVFMETGNAFRHQTYGPLFLSILLYGLLIFSIRGLPTLLQRRKEILEDEITTVDFAVIEEDLASTDDPEPAETTSFEPPLVAAQEPRVDNDLALVLSASYYQAEPIDLLLEIARTAMDCNSVALLWPDPESRLFTLRSISTLTSGHNPGPFPPGIGIIGALQQEKRDIVTVAGMRAGSPALPLFRDQENIGSAIAISIPLVKKRANESEPRYYAILCADRENDAPWNDAERRIFCNLAHKIALDIRQQRQMTALSLERNTFQRVCMGLRELNCVLGIEQVYDATLKAVASLVHFDFLAINLADASHHRITRAWGKDAERLQGQEFAIHEGLVGQVIKRNHWLPAAGIYHGTSPIFGEGYRTSETYPSVLILPLRNDDGRPIGTLTVASKLPRVFSASKREILELIATQVAVKVDLALAHEKINRLATTDGLTGLANHRTFQHGFNVMLERTVRNHCPLCLILCDIDHFKQINDTHGHPFGDHVLQRVSSVFSGATRKIDLAARYGGEEFALLLEGADEKGGRQLAERVRSEIAALEIRHDGKSVKVTISLGLAFYPKDATDKESLISYADQALYKAKALGRNRVFSWSEIRRN